MNSTYGLTQAAYNRFCQKFNIVAAIQLNHTDENFEKLKEILESTRKEAFDPNDRYLIAHADTDYYLPECPYGLAIFNLVRTFLNLDIPLNTLLFVTNHYGIRREFEILIPNDMHEHNFPTIIDNCLSCFTVTSLAHGMTEPAVDAQSITHHGVSMLGVARVHRNILFNELKQHDLLEYYAVSYRGEE